MSRFASALPAQTPPSYTTAMRTNTISVVLALVAATATASAQDQGGTIVVRGGFLFDGVQDKRVPNTGIVVRGGVFQEVGADLKDRDLTNARVVQLTKDDTVLPGLFDLHAHFGIDLFGRGRIDETEHYPRIFLGNGVTSVFPAGEMTPDKMADLRRRIDAGKSVGPRIFNSGPYFGSARPGWNRNASAEQIRKEVDEWAEKGARGFKAKGIRANQLRALIDQAHRHGLTVTGHLGSGSRGSVNPRDAIAMGIDRIEHFLGGDALPATRSAYASLVDATPDTQAFRRIAKLYIDRGVYFDATMSAYGYFGHKEPKVFKYWIDEREFFTPWFQEYRKQQRPRRVFEQFEKIYYVKRKMLKAFFDAGGGHLITLGTDHPSWGEFVSGCGVHRELHCMVLAGIPKAAALKIATINGARALGVGDKLGSIEPGKLADLVVVRGNPLDDIRATRNARFVMVAGRTHDPKKLLASAKGKIGPSNEDERVKWVARRRRR
jgi:imidazolonepropionase-like amidohydrolase